MRNYRVEWAEGEIEASALLDAIDELRASVRHEADCVEAAKVEIEAMRATQQLALEVLENVRGNINPERGYADELEADVERAIAAIAQPAPSVPTVAAAAAMGAKGGPALEGERLAVEDNFVQPAPSVPDDGFKRAVMEIKDIGYGAIFKHLICERAAELAAAPKPETKP